MSINTLLWFVLTLTFNRYCTVIWFAPCLYPVSCIFLPRVLHPYIPCLVHPLDAHPAWAHTMTQVHVYEFRLIQLWLRLYVRVLRVMLTITVMVSLLPQTRLGSLSSLRFGTSMGSTTCSIAVSQYRSIARDSDTPKFEITDHWHDRTGTLPLPRAD